MEILLLWNNKRSLSWTSCALLAEDDHKISLKIICGLDNFRPKVEIVD